jgi:hypothetical protein
MTQLQRVVNSVNRFTDPNECFDFPIDIGNEKYFMIITGTFNQHFLSFIHDMAQVDSIYICCEKKSKYN